MTNLSKLLIATLLAPTGICLAQQVDEQPLTVVPNDGSTLNIENQLQFDAIVGRRGRVLRADFVTFADNAQIETGKDGVAIIANSVVFGAKAKIHGPDIVFVADEIKGGSIDASGSPGKNASSLTDTAQNGSNGGAVFIAARKITDTQVSANGGTGGSGFDGVAGAPGDNGNPGANGWEDNHPFSNAKVKYGVPTGGSDGGPGKDAQAGTPGANGGNGGSVFIISNSQFARNLEFPEVDAGKGGSGGNAAKGGTPGKGGSGGKGVTGIRGTWGDGPNGKDSTVSGKGVPKQADGSDGAAGTGSTAQGKDKMTEVLAALQKSGKDRTALEQALKAIAKEERR